MYQYCNLQRQTSYENTHLLLHNLDDVNSAILLIKLQDQNLSQTIINILKSKLGDKDFEFYNTQSEIIDINRINRVNLSNRKIYFQEINYYMKNRDEISQQIDVFTQKYYKISRQEGQIQELQQLQHEKQQIEQQNQELEKQISQIRTQSQDDLLLNLVLQNEISNLMKEMQNQKQLIKKYEEECLKLKNENSTLQNSLREANFNLQTHIDLLNKEKNNKIQPKIRIQNRNIEPKNDQVSIQNSQLFQSNCKKQINYRNKCGHYLDISKIQQQVYFAIKVNKIAQCTRCQASLSSKLCLLVQEYGRSYLEIKNQIELSKLQQNLQMKLKNHEKLIKCPNNKCQFFWICQNNQKVQFGSFTQQKNGFCYICGEYFVINSQIQDTFDSQQNFFDFEDFKDRRMFMSSNEMDALLYGSQINEKKQQTHF